MTVSGPDVSAAPAAESGAEPVEPAAARPRSWGPGPAWRALRRRWRRSLRLRTAVLAALLSILAGLVVAAFTLLGPDTVEEAPDDGDAPEKAAPGAATTREEATR